MGEPGTEGENGEAWDGRDPEPATKRLCRGNGDLPALFFVTEGERRGWLCYRRYLHGGELTYLVDLNAYRDLLAK